MEARRLLPQNRIVSQTGFFILRSTKQPSDVEELNGTYIGYGATRDEMRALRYNDTENTANFSVGLFANSMGSQDVAYEFFFDYYSNPWNPGPQQWIVCYCLTQMRVTLIGTSPGILQLHSNFFPVSWKIPAGVEMEWDTFMTDANGTLSINDGSALKTRRWVAYKGSKDTVYNIGLYDGKLFKPRNRVSRLTKFRCNFRGTTFVRHHYRTRMGQL